MEKFQHLPKPVYQEPPTYNYSGFDTRKEEELYDQVTGSLLRLLSMRLALSFSVGTETATMMKRMHREDTKLKDAIGKHYKKLVMLERDKNTSFTMSDSVTDLVSILGFKKSKRHQDELSKESSSHRGADSGSEDLSDSLTRQTESRYTSLTIIDEDDKSLA